MVFPYSHPVDLDNLNITFFFICMPFSLKCEALQNRDCDHPSADLKYLAEDLAHNKCLLLNKDLC